MIKNIKVLWFYEEDSTGKTVHDKGYVVVEYADDTVVSYWGRMGHKFRKTPKGRHTFEAVVIEKLHEGYDVVDRSKASRKHIVDQMALSISRIYHNSGDKQALEDAIFLGLEGYPNIVVECIDNRRFENHFEVGVEYLCKVMKHDNMVVEDMHGIDIEIPCKSCFIVKED